MSTIAYIDATKEAARIATDYDDFSNCLLACALKLQYPHLQAVQVQVRKFVVEIPNSGIAFYEIPADADDKASIFHINLENVGRERAVEAFKPFRFKARLYRFTPFTEVSDAKV